MKSNLLILTFLVTASSAFSQTDSADFFYQKGLKEKEAGRKLEVWKNMDKAYKFKPDNKAIVSELANILLDLRKYGQAKEMFQKLEQLGENSPAIYKQILNLSFNTKDRKSVV